MILCLDFFFSLVLSLFFIYLFFYILSRLTEINQLKQEKEQMCQYLQMMQHLIVVPAANATGNFSIPLSILII